MVKKHEKMARPTEESINVSAIKLTDPYVKEIVDTAAHVVIYMFKSETSSWEKTNVEGALFIYRRNSVPKYNAFVLNRLSTQNLVEPIDEKFDIQVDEPYLLYRNSNGGIHCVWFYNPLECYRIANSVEGLVSELRKEKEKMGSPMKNEETNRRVLDFIALASGTPPQTATKPKAQSSPAFRTEFSDNALLQRLMSGNQPLSVQDIEKQHNIRRTNKMDENPKIPLCLPLTPQGKIENGLSYLRISESPPKVILSPMSSIPSQQFYNSNISPSSTTDQPVEVSALERAVTCHTIGMETPTKPALLPPTVFAQTPKEENFAIPEPLTKTQLLQAVSYLLKNDADFVKKLHEAYVKSFVEMVS